MYKIILTMLLVPFSLLGALNVAVSYPYIGAVTKKIGGDRVSVAVLAPGNWDPHFVVPRPSLIATLRRADALIMNGAELEVGWLPALKERANNTRLMDGGTLELSRHVTLIEIPEDTSRAGGDVHAQGNPHFHLDPRNILPIADAVAAFLSDRDPGHAAIYRDNLENFKAVWRTNLKRWDKAMQEAQSRKVVQYHGIFNYFLHAYLIESVGTIEPLPGIPPSTKHTMALIGIIEKEHVCCILHDVYHPTKVAEFITNRSGITLLTLPHDVGALDSASSLEALYDTLVKAVAP